MTVAASVDIVSYAGDDATVAFTVPFYFLANADLVVVLRSSAGVDTVKTITTHYTVSGAGNPAGGTVTFLTAPATGETVFIELDPARTQATDYVPNDPFPAETHEKVGDKLTMIARANRRLIDRSAKARRGETGPAIPYLADRQGYYAKWDASTGDFVVGVGEDTIEDLPAAVAAAEAAQEAAETAKTNAETAENNAEAAQSYAEEWANKAEDSLVSEDAGGNGSSEYSSRHWAAKAAASAAANVNAVFDDLAASYAVAGDGVTNDASNINTADADYASAGRALRFLAGNTYLIGTSITLSSNIVVEEGATLDVSDGVTLTIDGAISAPITAKIFETNTSGTIAGTFRSRPVSPFWWGLATDGTTRSSANDALMDAAVAAAAAAAVVLDFGNILVKRSSAKAYTTAGTYLWDNFRIEHPDATGGTEVFTFTGADFGTPIALTANVAVGAAGLTVGTGLSINAYERYVLLDTRDYNADAGSNTAKKSEYVTVKTYTSGTGAIVLTNQVQSSYVTASDASIAKVNYADMKLRLNGKIIGGGASLGQTAIKATCCTILGGRMEFDATEKRGFWADACRFEDYISIVATDVNLDGFGYPCALSGCDNPLVASVAAVRCRHAITGGGSSKTITVNSIACDFRQIGGNVGQTHGEDSTSSIFDAHPSWSDAVIESITGTMESDNIEPLVTMQGNDFVIGPVNGRGYDQAGVLVQFVGKPLDEPQSFYHFQAINVGSGGDGTDYLLAVENKNPTEEATFHIRVDSIVGEGRAGILLDLDSSAGSIFASFGHAQISVDSGNNFHVIHGAASGKVVVASIEMADLYSDYSSTSAYTIYLNGTTPAAAKSCLLDIKAGRLRRVGSSTFLTRVIYGDITLGADVLAEFDSTNFKITSNGNVWRTDRTAATA